MSKPLTDIERDLAAHLLEMAADEFGNHGCNDFDLAKHVTSRHERYRIMLADAELNGDQEWRDIVVEQYETGHAMDYMQDHCLMSYLAARLRGDA